MTWADQFSSKLSFPCTFLLSNHDRRRDVSHLLSMLLRFRLAILSRALIPLEMLVATKFRSQLPPGTNQNSTSTLANLHKTR